MLAAQIRKVNNKMDLKVFILNTLEYLTDSKYSASSVIYPD
jgi:hypothetical protein